MKLFELTGQERSHITQKEGYAIHIEAEADFDKMVAAAKREGINLKAFSSFRDFNTQTKIWNRKFTGERPIYDREGVNLDFASLSRTQILEAILNWSALPGTSRHHWGTEIDLIDTSLIGTEYQIELLPYEYESGGPFFKLNQWMEANLEDFNFFRPYLKDQSGVAFEPWHVSYYPLSSVAIKELTPSLLKPILEKTYLEGKDLVLEKLDWIFETYVYHIAKPKKSFALPSATK
ncbi:MAG: M15 family metallopeptidase [SAR324 cluster bacterium]|nr:M15 family metallopeptidase [SAR324 cluster bacterium]